MLRKDQMRALVAGYSMGVLVTTLMADALLRQERKKHADQFQKQAMIGNFVVQKSWPHLPPEVKDEINETIAFHNIVVHEVI